MRAAIITGSFDPITSGHLDLIKRSARMFDKVYVVVLANTEKAGGIFSPAERLLFIDSAIADCGANNVEALSYSGLTSDIAAKLGADFIVRGARCASDYDYEYTLSLIMKRFSPKLETVILPTAPEYSMISSSYVRDLLKYGCDLGDAVPDSCREMIKEAYKTR